MNVDKIAAAIALLATVLSASGLPSTLGLGPQAVVIIGGLIVAFAATWRAFIGKHVGWADWRDILGAVLGIVAIGLGIEGVAVDQLDPDILASASSFAAMVFAGVRGSDQDGGTTGAGLVLLVLACCEVHPVNATCAEFAAERGETAMGGADPSAIAELYKACTVEVDAGRDVCVRDSPRGCRLIVRGRQP